MSYTLQQLKQKRHKKKMEQQIKDQIENEHIRQGIKEFSEWPTIPQLYIKKEFVGGCDILKEMYESGELKKILEKKQINFKK